METVFDHGITEKERERIGIVDKDLYLKHIDEESARLDLAFLYYERGDKNKVKKNLEGLNQLAIIDFWRTVTHPWLFFYMVLTP